MKSTSELQKQLDSTSNENLILRKQLSQLLTPVSSPTPNRASENIAGNPFVDPAPVPEPKNNSPGTSRLTSPPPTTSMPMPNYAIPVNSPSAPHMTVKPPNVNNNNTNCVFFVLISYEKFNYFI